MNHDSGNSKMGLFALDGLFVHVSIGESIGIVAKYEVGSIGSVSNGNQVNRHFLFKLGPFNVRVLDDTVDLGHRESIIFTEGFGFGSTQLSQELFGTRYVIRLFPVLGSKEDGVQHIVCHGG